MTLTLRQIKKVVEGGGYKLLNVETGKHFKVTVANDEGRTARITVSVSPRSQSHWPHFVLADIKKRMR
jgi:hypothetical protein